jgi:maleamate amidohydrolase
VSMATWRELLTADERIIYERAGYGRTYAIGRRPALLIVDVTHAFVGPEPAPILTSIQTHRLSCGEAGWRSIEHILAAFRRLGLPVLYTVGVDGPATARAATASLTGDGPIARAPHVVPAAIAPLETETVLPKIGPSAFFGTPLTAHLTGLGVDTVVVVGGTTSGCVRATVVDAYSQKLRTLVVEEAVFDRAEIVHQVNLLDMDSKYAEVIPGAELLARLEAWAAGPVPE